MTPSVSGLDSSVDLVGLRAYLRYHGWTPSGERTDRFEIWTQDSVSTREILLPLNTRAADFDRRIRNLFDDLSGYEGVAPESVQAEVKTVDDDVVEFKTAHLYGSSEGIPLKDAAHLVEGTRKLVVLAACSTLERRSYHGKSHPKEALSQARTVRMGHTRKGSYIVPIISPVDALEPTGPGEDPALDFDVERVIFSRRVIGTLADSLDRLHDIGVRSAKRPSQAALNEAVTVGVSGDLCLQLAKMLGTPALGDLDVSFRWAFTARQPQHAIREVHFPNEAESRIREIGERLRGEVELSERVLYGYVSSLERDAEDDEGTIRMRTLIGRQQRLVKLVLDSQQYHIASQANDERLRVVVAGQVADQNARMPQFTRVDRFELDNYLPIRPD